MLSGRGARSPAPPDARRHPRARRRRGRGDPAAVRGGAGSRGLVLAPGRGLCLAHGRHPCWRGQGCPRELAPGGPPAACTACSALGWLCRLAACRLCARPLPSAAARRPTRRPAERQSCSARPLHLQARGAPRLSATPRVRSHSPLVPPRPFLRSRTLQPSARGRRRVGGAPSSAATRPPLPAADARRAPPSCTAPRPSRRQPRRSAPRGSTRRAAREGR